MKLVYIANIRMPTEKAHGVQIMKMCEAFAIAGNDVELIVPSRLNKIKDDPFRYYGIPPVFKITKLPCLDLVRFGKIGFIFQAMTFLCSVKFFLFFKMILGRRYDVLYTREEMIALFFNHFVLEIHTLPTSRSFLRGRGAFNKIFKKADAIVVISNFLRNELIERGGLPESIFVSPDGVDLEKFGLDISQQEARVRLGLPMQKRIVVYSGSFYLYDWKGVDILLQALDYLPGDTALCLVGGNQNEIESIKKRYIDNQNLFLFGHRPHAEIPYFLAAADVLALPNKTGDKISEFYTSPMKLFEYMASGRPIVASDISSIREILNASNAVLVRANTPKDLAEGIMEILGNSTIRDKISAQAKIDVRKYDWQVRSRNILDFINRTRCS